MQDQPSEQTNSTPYKTKQKKVFLNYRSKSDARAALSKITQALISRNIPEIFQDGVVRCFLKSEGPSKPPAQNQRTIDHTRPASQDDSDSEDSEDPEADDHQLVDTVVEKLKATPAGMSGAGFGNMVSRNATWRREIDRAGGVKMWCEDNEGKVKFINDSSAGRVVLDLAQAAFSAKDFVKLNSNTPSTVRGAVPMWAIGVVKSVDVNTCVVDFRWKGSVKHVMKASQRDSVLADSFEPPDDFFDKHAFVRKKEPNVFEFTGDASDSRPAVAREYGFVRSKQECGKTSKLAVQYFELEIVRDNKIGIAIGLCGDSFVAGRQLGWDMGAVGYHSDDGKLFFKTDGHGASFGPTATVGDKMGCGLICGNLSTSCYFTHNGRVVGRILLSKKTDGESANFFPAVSSSAPAVVKINLNATPPSDTTSTGCVLTTSKWQAKHSLNHWKVVSRQGPPSLSNGEIPVTFAGYENIVWVVGNEVGMEDQPFASFELACLMADEGEQTIVMRKSISIQGNSTDGRKPVISVSGGFVFDIRSNVSMKNICIKSTGGDASDRIDKGGAAGVVLTSGKLELSCCDIQSVNGTGVAVSDNMKPSILNISDCSIGPCGRYGLLVNGSGNHKISDLRITACQIYGLVTNPTVHGITIERCNISKCPAGIRSFRPSDLVFKDTAVSDCSKRGIFVEGPSTLAEGSVPASASFEGCTITRCPRALLAHYHVTAHWGATNAITDSKIDTEAMFGAVVEQDKSADESPEDGTKKENSGEGYGQVGSEEDNFARYFRLLHHTATSVLQAVFKASFRKSAGKEWAAECGKELYKTLPRESASKLGKESRVTLEGGSTDTWDITLLSSLLLFSPGYLKGAQGEPWCTAIRTQRNQLNHSPPIFKCSTCSGDCSCGLGQPIMATADFDAKWRELSSAITKLTASVLSSEEHEKFASQVEEMKTHKFKVSEDREVRDIFQSELKSVMDRVSKIEENGVTKSFLGRVLENFESLFRGNGTIDKSKLPQKVVLSNDKHYTLIKKAGAGGMGTVFVAVAQDSEEHVALKVCDGGDRQRAEREAEVLRRLTMIDDHENVVRFIESAIHNNHYVIVMELVTGNSLEEWLEKRGREASAWEETKDIMLGIASGMAQVHKIEISHRDLKPANVMLDEATGKVVIVDFGLSKQSNAGQTMTVVGGAGFGTKPYMSPEQVDPEFGEVYLTADVWAMGVIWYEVLAGITPFEPIIGNDSKAWASSSQDQRASLKITQTNLLHESKMIQGICGMERDWERLRDDVPPPIVKVIDRCLQHKKALRYQTASELLDHIQDAFASLAAATLAPAEAPAVKPFAQWSVAEVCELLVKCGFAEQARLCEEEGVDGKTWESLSAAELKEDLGMSSLKLKRFQAELAQ